MPARSSAITPRIAARFAVAAAVVDVVCVIATILFFSLESTSARPHVFGPVSDATTALFDALFSVVVLYFVRTVASARLRAFGWVTFVATLVGAANSLLLVLNVMPDAWSLGITLVVIAVQAVWFVCLGVSARRNSGIPRGLGTFAMIFGVVMLVALVAVAIPGGWVVVAGPGILAWAAWPVWLLLLARSLRTFGASAEIA